jgi:hypothetical protein
VGKITLALASDLFDVLLPLLCGTNLIFQEKLLLAPRDETAEVTKSVQRNSTRGLHK